MSLGTLMSCSRPKTGFRQRGDMLKVYYGWDETTGATLRVLNLTDRTEAEVTNDTLGLAFDIGDDDDENFTIGVREKDNGQYDRHRL